MKKIGKLIKGIAGIADNAFLGGVISNFKEKAEGFPEGKINWGKVVATVISSTIPIILLILLATGKITMEDVQKLWDLFD